MVFHCAIVWLMNPQSSVFLGSFLLALFLREINNRRGFPERMRLTDLQEKSVLIVKRPPKQLQHH